jgi:hypothetical protein
MNHIPHTHAVSIHIKFSDRHVTSEHLPWAKSRSPEADETLLMTKLEELAERFSRAATPPPPPTTADSTHQETAVPTTTTAAEETSKE